MSQKSKQNYHHGDLRVALIDAAVEMIGEQGTEKLTMRNLSERIGVSRTASYRHFSDKADLLTAIAIEGFQRFSQSLNTARTDESEDIVSRFRNMGKAYIVFAVENPAYYRLMFGDKVVQKNETMQSASNTAFNELLQIILLLQTHKIIADDDANLQAVYVWSLMHGLASLVIDNKLKTDMNIEEIMAFFEQRIQKSLLPICS